MNLCAEWIFVICLAFVFDLILFLDISPCFILTSGLRLVYCWNYTEPAEFREWDIYRVVII